jgi:DNA-binding transcriptional MerR regulator
MVDLQALSSRCGVHPDLIGRFVDLGLLDPLELNIDRRQWYFAEDALQMVRKIIRMRNQLGINYTGIGVVLDLLERIDRLEARIQELENTGT